MGMFSWLCQDTKEAIRNNVHGYQAQAFMHDNKGNVWAQKDYDGYGMFGGKDFFQLVAEMNNCEGLTGVEDTDRSLGIDLCYSGKPMLSPNLTREPDWTWRNEKPEDDPNQGWGSGEDYDVDDNGRHY
jgi:hypothetical protein